MPKKLVLIVCLLLLVGLLDLSAADPAFPEGRQQWDLRAGFGNAIPDSWNPNLHDYELRMEGSVRPENRVAVFRSGLATVVHRAGTDAESEGLKQVLAGPSDPPAWVFTAMGSAAGAFDPTGVSTVAPKLFLWALNRTEAVQAVKRTQQGLNGIITKGGEVLKMEEIVSIEGQTYLRMSWPYRAKVGDEVRVVPFAFIYSRAR